MLKSNCVCDNPEYKYNGKVGKIALCHCQQPRKTQGNTIVATIAYQYENQFTIIAGKKDPVHLLNNKLTF